MEAEYKRKLACDSCKKKKLKCEWEQDHICIRCSRTGIECVPQPKHERKKREKKPNTYLSSLEDRLQRMEAAIQNATPHGASQPSQDRESETIVDNMSLLKINEDGSSVYVGAASGFSIFSPQGLKWIHEKTGDDAFSKIIANMPSPSAAGKAILGPNIWHQMPDEECSPLPARNVAICYIDIFFRGFGAVMPVFDEASFRSRFASRYPINRSDDVVWYACLNVVFALTSIGEEGLSSAVSSPKSRSPKSPIDYKVQDMEGWKWFRNACSTFTELQFQEGNLHSVQAMVGLAFLLQTLPDPYPCILVSGVALRMAQTMGIHRTLGYSGLSASELEQRRNTFWVALMIERGVSFRMGRPSVVHEDDIGIDLPRSDGSRLYAGHLRDMAKISLMQGRIYNKLYSAKSLSQSTSERLQWVGVLDEELQQWRDGIPHEIRPGNKIPSNLDLRETAAILLIHLTYFNALTIIHRVSNHLGPWTDTVDSPFGHDSDESKLNPRVFAGGAICVNAARSIISLLETCSIVIESGDFNIIRIMAYFPLTASLMLFTSVLENPSDSQAVQDVERMDGVLTFLLRFYGDESSFETTFLRKTFAEANRLARVHVTNAQMQGNQGPKRRGDKTDLTGSRLAKRKEGLSTSNTSPINTLPDNPADNPYASISQSKDVFTFDGSNGFNSPFTATGTPSELQTPAQPYLGADQLFENDPIALLDGSDSYGDGSSLSRNENSQWTGMDNFFMPEDGSWFFPISNQWDVNNPMGEFPNEMADGNS